MLHNDQPYHQCADPIRYIASYFPYFINVIGSYGHGDVKTQEFSVVVLELVAPLYFLFEFLIVFLKCDQFISASVPAHLKHDAITGICSQIGKDRMLGEVKVLEADNFAII
jgi:hypothetical protein